MTIAIFRKHICLIRAFWKLSFRKLSEFRTNVVLIFTQWIISIAIILVFWKTIFQYINVLKDWNFPELAILNAMCYISWGIFILFNGFYALPRKVLRGALDKYLCRPINPLIGLIGEEFRLEAFYQIFAGILIIILVVIAYQLNISPINFLIGIIFMSSATLIIVLIHGVIALSSFWLGKITALQQFLDDFDEFQRYPVNFFPSTLRIFLTFIFPVALAGSYPVSIMLDKTTNWWPWVAVSLLLSCLWFVFFIILWKRALVRYESLGG